MIKKNKQTIIIKKIKKHEQHVPHGGAWKVAYADFVTAMMAFFLVMWLISSTSIEQKEVLAQYFSATGIEIGQKGMGGLLGGKIISDETDGAEAAGSPILALDPSRPPSPDGEEEAEHDNVLKYVKSLSKEDVEKLQNIQQALNNQANKQLKALEQNVKHVLESFAQTKGLMNNIIVSISEEGLQIQLVDQQKQSMFPLGSDKMYPYTYAILKQLAKAISNVPNQLSITGHTDATPYSDSKNFSNWELSAQRALAARRALNEFNIPESRIHQVVGKASSDLLNKKDPHSSENRRISIVLRKLS